MAFTTKEMLLAEVARRTDISQDAICSVLDTISFLALAELREGREFKLPGIGKLVPVFLSSAKKFNPLTGKHYRSRGRPTVRLRPSSIIEKGIAE